MGRWVYLGFLPLLLLIVGGGYNFLSTRWHGKPLRLASWLVIPQLLGIFILTYPKDGIGVTLLPICILTAVGFGILYLILRIVRDHDLLLRDFFRSYWRYLALLSGGWYVFALILWGITNF
ncbi:DUF3397 family protein [Schleiferilactobacillus perolens]|uniref:DUF3397 family protein n=1 Tax=Schleiferilactobacillus perolens TaxID=100468 RepID=UPI00071021C7|nr:DUF3397 family protein [Schleiferilactobacillus perolens]